MSARQLGLALGLAGVTGLLAVFLLRRKDEEVKDETTKVPDPTAGEKTKTLDTTEEIHAKDRTAAVKLKEEIAEQVNITRHDVDKEPIEYSEDSPEEDAREAEMVAADCDGNESLMEWIDRQLLEAERKTGGSPWPSIPGSQEERETQLETKLELEKKLEVETKVEVQAKLELETKMEVETKLEVETDMEVEKIMKVEMKQEGETILEVETNSEGDSNQKMDPDFEVVNNPEVAKESPAEVVTGEVAGGRAGTEAGQLESTLETGEVTGVIEESWVDGNNSAKTAQECSGHTVAVIVDMVSEEDREELLGCGPQSDASDSEIELLDGDFTVLNGEKTKLLEESESDEEEEVKAAGVNLELIVSTPACLPQEDDSSPSPVAEDCSREAEDCSREAEEGISLRPAWQGKRRAGGLDQAR